jgi:hypothetical protein
MPDIGTWSVLGPPASTLLGTLVSSANDVQNDIRSLPSKMCSSICGRQSSGDFVTVTSKDSGHQSDDDQLQEKYDELVTLLENIPKTVPKGTKLGDLGWYLFWGQASVLAVGFVISKMTGGSLVVAWTGKLPASQVSPVPTQAGRPVSQENRMDRATWASLMQVFAKLKPAEIGSQTPHMEMTVDGQSITVSYFTAAGWVCRKFHVEAATVYSPGSIGPDMHIPLENQKLLEGTPFEEGSDVEFSAGDLLLYTPPGSVAGEDDLDQTAGV